ncbi:hypothetical protein [Romboutsia ilealis]|uniref:hypothetical protein n=1 Tax=Romboutsia ilealis TaxID=1115758 RepID=UPI0027297194|nr:hypothetical protein [Romboutsia ilealis]
MCKKLYAVLDNYFEDCVFVSYDKKIIKRFMQYPVRKSRYDVLSIKDNKIKKEFEKNHSRDEAYTVVGDNVLLNIEYETYINTIPTTIMSIQSSIEKIVRNINMIKLNDYEKDTINDCLKILYETTCLYFHNNKEIINHDKNIKKFISEEII